MFLFSSFGTETGQKKHRRNIHITVYSSVHKPIQSRSSLWFFLYICISLSLHPSPEQFGFNVQRMKTHTHTHTPNIGTHTHNNIIRIIITRNRRCNSSNTASQSKQLRLVIAIEYMYSFERRNMHWKAVAIVKSRGMQIHWTTIICFSNIQQQWMFIVHDLRSFKC